MKLQANNKELVFDHAHVMGILNVTPDSFSDGGSYTTVELAVAQAKKMIEVGVSVIDIGGESTRPGAAEVTLEEELHRVIPAIKAIREFSDVWISVDTSKAEVIRQAVEAGADIINDVRSLTEPGALEAAAEANVPVCLMHMQGEPKTMQNNPNYRDFLPEVVKFLRDRIDQCAAAGISKKNIIIDPGFGFGKTVEHNYQLLAHMDWFQSLGYPVLAGLSRKSMIFKVLEKEPAECVAGSVACATIAAMKGAQIIRVHDFAETLDALSVVRMLQLNK
ncbi:dihydropteroate synthase [Vibrio albus]|jgi:dihydropteroate synthase|uniref:Dihydropteroate synthase n=1 Tax=Vibrio albus TaxID=2200953 RepID=A0A2U3BEU0_9VIBR|nr:dihydropteroate synthase [Vibrio albus]PWI35272.1 dihydropteroate synthase [Vibrio albus]